MFQFLVSALEQLSIVYCQNEYQPPSKWQAPACNENLVLHPTVLQSPLSHVQQDWGWSSHLLSPSSVSFTLIPSLLSLPSGTRNVLLLSLFYCRSTCYCSFDESIGYLSTVKKINVTKMKEEKLKGKKWKERFMCNVENSV